MIYYVYTQEGRTIMRDTYFGLNECTEDELMQLKEELFYSNRIDFDLSAEDVEFINNLSYADDIPYSILEKAYGHISFVEEDFWCNC